MVAITHPRLLRLERPGGVSRPASAAVYRRRRLLAVGIAFVVAALVLALVSSFQPVPGVFAGQPAANVTYVVEDGDTVWSIAESLAPGRDPRPVVDAIVVANGGASIVAGQRLVLELP
jgi:hypothetical protein